MERRRPVGEPGRGEQIDSLRLRSAHPILTREQERILFVAYKTHNNRIQFQRDNRDFEQTFNNEDGAKDREQIYRIIRTSATVEDIIAACNFRLVDKIARYYRWDGLTPEQKIQAGQIGLRKAIERFDLAREGKLSTYAPWYVRKEILKLISEEGFAVPISPRVMQGMGWVAYINAAYLALYNREPTRDQLRMQLEVHGPELPIYDIFLYMDRIKGKVDSLQQSIGKKEDRTGRTKEDLLSDPDSNTEEEAFENMLLSRMMEILATLSPEMQYVVRARFGFGTGKGHSIPEIAQSLGVPLDQVWEMLNGALKVFQQDSMFRKEGETEEITQETETPMQQDSRVRREEKTSQAIRESEPPQRTVTDDSIAERIENGLQRIGITSRARIEEYIALADYLLNGLDSAEIAQKLRISLHTLSQKKKFLERLGIVRTPEPRRRAVKRTNAIKQTYSDHSLEIEVVGKWMQEHPRLSRRERISAMFIKQV